MKKIVIALLCLLAANISCQANKSVIDLKDIIAVFDFKNTLPEATAEQDADEIMALAVKTFTAKGFTKGLTGEGYGGPCVIIDGFYKGGCTDKELYSFIPTDAKNACVIEMSACNDGDGGDYELYMTMDLYDKENALEFMDQLGVAGYELILSEEYGNIRSYSNGKYVIDYAYEGEYAHEMYCFRIQTVARKTKFDY
ncbi:MAG: hypothetical protein J6S96_09095 [Muribaculaceae bacterium]|nr:hypothetical protein [Muribaculaceae bacterium]